MPKKFIALILAVVMTSQMITPVISYGEDKGTGASAASVEDSVSSGSRIVIEEPTEITAEPTEIYSSGGSYLKEIISADFSESGSCGDSVTYYYDSDTYTLTISGTGAMKDYSSASKIPWYSVSGEIVSVIIENGVTSIGNYAFYSCYGLTSISIPDSVTSIGSYAFSGCSGLTSIPDNVTSIGDYAFSNCDGLTSITITDNITSLGDYVFYGCDGLTSVIIADGVTSIGNGTFSSCDGLTSISIPDSVTSIGDYTFSYCDGLTSISIPDSVISIGNGSFYECYGLTSIIIPDSVTSIGSHAFYCCYGLTSLIIPDSVTSIGDHAFEECTSLTSVTISNSVTSISDGTFMDCTSLTSITIPDSVTSIDEYAFNSCTSLTSISIPDSVTSIGNVAFYFCESLSNVTIPDSVTSIGNGAFNYCTSLTSITIPDGLTSIGEYAFDGCKNLTSVTIPDSVTSIGDNAFSECENVVLYVYPGSCAEEYAIVNEIPYVYISGEVREISLSVETEDGTAVSEGYEVIWYENSEYAGSGDIFYTYSAESTITYEIYLDEELSFIYYQPEEQTAEANKITCVLSEIPTVTLDGNVSDSDGGSAAGAAVTLKQTTASGYSKTVETVTDSRGRFSAEVLNIGTNIVVSADGYYNGYAKIISNDNIAESYDEIEIVLEALPSNKITLSMYVSKTTDSEITTPLTNTNGLEFSLYNNTQGKSIDSFTVQYPYIILESGEVNSGDSISVIAKDTTGSMTADEALCTMDDTSGGEAKINFLKNGYFTVNLTGADNKTAMVFDNSGSFVTKYTTSSVNITSDSFTSGSYSIAIMEKTSLLPVIDSLSRLDELGFEQGSDYVLKSISIEKGTETDMGTVAVPTLDETKLYYTDSASLTANKTECPVGSLVLMTAKYDIQSQYDTSGQSVTISLPAGCECYSGSVYVNGETASYTTNGNDITINTGLSSATVRMYVVCGSVGECNINGFLNFTNEGSKITQPIGGTVIDVVDIEFYVTSYSSNSTVSIYGTAGIGSTVTIYDNDVEVGTTRANSVGSWITDIDLYKPGALSYHSIYIIAETGDTSKIISDTKSLIYNGSKQGALSSITVYYTAHDNLCMVFDFENGSFPSSYNYSNTTFSYEVKFTEETNIDKLSNVCVVTMDSSKNITSIPCTYDSEFDRWICSYDYADGSSVPAYVTATYDYDNSDDYVEVFDEDTLVEFAEEYWEYQEALSIELEDSLEIGEPIEGDGYYEFEMGLNNDSGVYTEIGTLRLESPDYSEFNLSEWQEKGCIEMGDDNGAVLYCLSEMGDNYITYSYVAPDDEAYFKMTLFCDASSTVFADLAGETDVYTNADLAAATAVLLLINSTSNIIKNVGDANINMNNLNSYYAILSNENSVNEKLLEAICKYTGEYRLTESQKMTFTSEIQEIYVELEDYLAESRELVIFYAISKTIAQTATDMIMDNMKFSKLLKSSGFTGVSKAYDSINGMFKNTFNVLIKSDKFKFVGNYVNSLSKDEQSYLDKAMGAVIKETILDDKINNYLSKNVLGLDLNSLFNASVYIENSYNDLHASIMQTKNSILAAYSECGNGDGSGDGGGSSGGGSNGMGFGNLKDPFKKITPVYDPSGYVYEAVPSNRLEGVTTTVYYSESESGENAEVWDAEDYDQTNPLTTDSNGNYAWDVPLGYWQVKYEKSGYTTSYSEWLPVPPPQFDVNQALVSTTAPSVESVNVYEDEIQVIFSKYMKLSAGETITVTIDGEEVEGTVTASNAEYNGDETEEYANIFIFTPNENISGEATVSVAPAEGYNGLMTSAYSVTKTAVVRPRYINSADSITVKYNSGALLEVEILPNEAAEGLVLEASTASDAIATVTNETITLDSSGTANVMLNGELMGQTVLILSIQGTDISKIVTVNVSTNADESSKCAKVTAIITSGSTVEYGTELVLSTETDGAEIYYTLDGTCPCTVGSESRLLYTEPLVLTEDTFIIAYAVKDGYDDSNTAGFIYTIADSGDDTTEESTEESTEASTETVSESTTETTTETKETSTETTTATADATTESTTKAASSSSSSGGGGGGSSSTCTVKLVPNNGVNSSTTYVKKNSTLAEPDTPVYDGYTFTGWYTDSDCKTLYDFSAKVTSSFTLYGGWKEADENEAENDEIETAEEETVDTEKSVFERIVKVVIGSTAVTVETDGQESTYTMDTAPYIQSESSSTLVPLRFVAVAVYGDEVDNADSSDIVAWDSATKTASITVGDNIISFTAGSEYMDINGKDILMSNGVKAEITDGRMFIPFRALGEALGVEVDWDSTTKTAIYTAE